MKVSIHAPRMRGDAYPASARLRGDAVSIHAPRMRGDLVAADLLVKALVSIHAPRMRGDFSIIYSRKAGWAVSIHAPRMRGDDGQSGMQQRSPCFNPRPSHEGRLEMVENMVIAELFQSTPLA